MWVINMSYLYLAARLGNRKVERRIVFVYVSGNFEQSLLTIAEATSKRGAGCFMAHALVLGDNFKQFFPEVVEEVFVDVI